MLAALALSVALYSEDPQLEQVERFYWDCDTAYMRGELGPESLYGCLEVTEQFKIMAFGNDHRLFMQYWRQQNLTEWYKRGYTPKMEDLPRLR